MIVDMRQDSRKRPFPASETETDLGVHAQFMHPCDICIKSCILIYLCHM